MRWHSHPCFLLVGHNDSDPRARRHRRMPKRPAPEDRPSSRSSPHSRAEQGGGSLRLGGVMESPRRSRPAADAGRSPSSPPPPMELAAAAPGANSRLEDAAAAAAAAAVAAADDFDVRVSLSPLGSIRPSRLDDLISIPGAASSPRKRDVAAAVDAVVGLANGAHSKSHPEGSKLGEEISDGMQNAIASGGRDGSDGTPDNNSNANANGDATGVDGDGGDDDDDDDDGTSPRKSGLSPRHSIDDASVDTKIESVTANDVEKAAEEAGDDEAPTAAEDEKTTIKLLLTPEESRLFDLLTRSAEAYEKGELTVDPNGDVSARGGFVKTQQPADETSWLKPPPEVEKIEIRVAGGWVRDKLLRQHSCDVDIALDCMMGVQFARIVQSYLKLQQEEKEDEVCELQLREAEEGGGTNGDAETTLHCENSNSKKGKAQKKQKKKTKQPKIGVIGANPSQSKHLETATMTIHAIDIDFVNLRAEEVYLPGSRIPTSDTRMFGTPLEDALRRDFTINSLFYNVRSGRIEDWTGRGLNDLMVHRRIVTPVDPHVTFHDDPLRVLRAIRFAVRLGFDLDERIVEAARSKRVHHSLHAKVSRERVGKEVEGMLSGKHARPGEALNMIAGLHLAGSVFCFPGSFPGDGDGNYSRGPNGGPVVSGDILGVTYRCGLASKGCADAAKLASRQRARGWEESSALLAELPALIDGHADERESILLQETLPMPLTELNERLLHLCAFILPFRNLTFPDKKGTRTTHVTAHMIKEALKMPVRDVQAVSKILSNVDEMTTILSEVRSQLEGAPEDGSEPNVTLCRLRMGLLLRSLKEHWVTCLATAAAWELRSRERKGAEIEGDDFRAMVASSKSPPPTSTVAADRPSRALYHAVLSELDLDECWSVPPLLNGKELIRELDLPKGPIVGEYLDDQTRWMLLHPGGTREECADHLRARKREREVEGRAEEDAEVAVNGEGVAR